MLFSRAKKIYEVYCIILTFFKRKVMGWGLMKNKFFRMILFGMVLLFIGGLTAMMYMFWKNNESTIEQTQIVLDVYSLTVMMWTFCCFLFIKILFMKTDRFLKFTCQLPVTQREIKTAVLMFELVISLLVIFTVSTAVVLSLLIHYGAYFIERILCNVLFIPITLFLFLDLIYVLMEYVLELFGITKMKGVVMFCLNVTILLLMYVVGYGKLTDSLLFGYINQEGTSIIVIYAYLADKYGFLLAVSAFLTILILLIAGILSVPAAWGGERNAYLKLRSCVRKPNMFVTYILSMSRDVDSLSYTVIAYFIFLVTLILRNEYGICSIVILSLNGLYGYVHTDALRNLWFQKAYSALQDYCCLIGSQFVCAVIFSLPMMLISLIVYNSFKVCLLTLLLLLFSIVLFTMVGVLFPAKKDNPFSPCVGIGVVMVFAIFIIAIYGLLDVQVTVQIVGLIAMICASSLLSVMGIQNLKRSACYEKNQ